jgi:bifunctional ADP-heptose synthase (sugar kinase/adenylyltransferase)
MTRLNFGEAQWHTPALAGDVVSVCGAGDTAIAAFAYQYCKTQDIVNAMRFASKACAVVVGKPYTAVASHEEINKIKG